LEGCIVGLVFGLSGISEGDQVGVERRSGRGGGGSLLCLLGFQQSIKDFIGGYVVFIIKMFLFCEFGKNVESFNCVEVDSFAL
jgi:hypothetical protein